MEFRRASALDAPKIAELEDRIFSDAWSDRAVTDCICRGGMCFVATEGDELFAYIIGMLIAPEGEIYRLAVREDKRKRGIAYRLLDYAVKTERGRGLETLFLEVRSQNVAARGLYRAYGFEEISVRKNYYHNPTDDAVIMLKANKCDMRMPYKNEDGNL